MTTLSNKVVDTQELLPCPWCGGEAVLRQDDDPGYPFYVTFNHIDSCVGYAVPTDLFRSFATEAEAIRAWNTRTTQCSGDTQELLGALDRLHDNLASAPHDAEKCFVSLDDHRVILSAFRTTHSPSEAEAFFEGFKSGEREGFFAGYNKGHADDERKPATAWKEHRPLTALPSDKTVELRDAATDALKALEVSIQSFPDVERKLRKALAKLDAHLGEMK